MSDAVRAGLASIGCLVRSLPLFFRRTPRTPLRVLGIIAFDTLHVLRHSRPLPRARIRELATLMDFEGCTNAAWDHKTLCEADYRATSQRLENAGLGGYIRDYLCRLRDLEGRRPPIGGDHRLFEQVRIYREAVIRLSLGTVAAVALRADSLDDQIRAIHCDADVDTLFRIAMQCQIIDDALDYTEDLSAGLPSFLTASASLPQAIEWTGRAARHYADGRDRISTNGVLPLRVALGVVTAITTVVIRVTERRHRMPASTLLKMES